MVRQTRVQIKEGGKGAELDEKNRKRYEARGKAASKRSDSKKDEKAEAVRRRGDRGRLRGSLEVPRDRDRANNYLREGSRSSSLAWNRPAHFDSGPLRAS